MLCLFRKDMLQKFLLRRPQGPPSAVTAQTRRRAMSITTPRIGPWTAIGLMIAVFIVLEIVLPMARAAVTPLLTITGPRDRVALQAASSIALVWILFAAACVLLRLRGQSLRDIGWMRPARAWGWVLAVLFAAIYGGGVVSNMIRVGAPVTTDWSLWRIAI